MIKEVTYYDIICDRCGKSLTNESGDYYPDTDSAEMVASQSEWGRMDNIHLCPECFEAIKNITQLPIQGTSTCPDPWKSLGRR